MTAPAREHDAPRGAGDSKKAAAGFARETGAIPPKDLRSCEPTRPHLRSPRCAACWASLPAGLTRDVRAASARTTADAALSAQVRAIHDCSRGTYGARRIPAALVELGVHVSRKQIARRPTWPRCRSPGRCSAELSPTTRPVAAVRPNLPAAVKLTAPPAGAQIGYDNIDHVATVHDPESPSPARQSANFSAAALGGPGSGEACLDVASRGHPYCAVRGQGLLRASATAQIWSPVAKEVAGLGAVMIGSRRATRLD